MKIGDVYLDEYFVVFDGHPTGITIILEFGPNRTVIVYCPNVKRSFQRRHIDYVLNRMAYGKKTV